MKEKTDSGSMIIEGGCGDWRRRRRRRRSRRQGMPNGAKGLMWKRMKGVGWTGYEGGGAVGIGGVNIGPTRQKETGGGVVAACCCSNETCVAVEVAGVNGGRGQEVSQRGECWSVAVGRREHERG